MCLAFPVRVAKLLEDSMARVELDGAAKDISLALVDDVQVGDYVVMHAGFALSKLDQEEAKRTLALFGEMSKANSFP